MNIAIIGYGKMGKTIREIALEGGHSVSVIVDPVAQESASIYGLPPSLPGGLQHGLPLYRSIEEAGGALDGVDAAIEFTGPKTAEANIKALAAKKMRIVSGSTGWYDALPSVKKAVEEGGGGLLYSSNFSIGVNLFYRIAWYAAKLAAAFPEFDLGGFEIHHNKKLDSPSGTAKTLVEGLLSRVEHKSEAVWETLNRRPEPNELHWTSLRVGSVPGRHSLFLDSPADTIEITHNARNREGFATGALLAASWLCGEGGKRGVFTIDEMLMDILDI